jgi:hypothetical protein
VAIDPVLAVLIAQLHRNGALDSIDLANMKRRLIESDREDLATDIDGVILSDLIDDPGNRRASIHVLPDGGNERG